MKSVSSQLEAHLEQDSTTLAACWMLTLVDGTVMAFTSFDQDIVYGGVTYLAASGVSPTAIASGSDMSVDNQDLLGFLDSEIITEADIRGGRYDGTTIIAFLVNWADLTQGQLKLKKGVIGNITLGANGVFHAEVRGLTQMLTTVLGNTYGPTCRAEFGDAQCKIDAVALQQQGSVQTVTGNITIVPAPGLVGGLNYFTGGLITFTSGANNGLSMEIKTWDGTTLGLFLPMPYLVAVGDTFTVQPGCDRLPQTCTSRYDNILNFRGEPYIPGTDAVMDYPNAT